MPHSELITIKSEAKKKKLRSYRLYFAETFFIPHVGRTWGKFTNFPWKTIKFKTEISPAGKSDSSLPRAPSFIIRFDVNDFTIKCGKIRGPVFKWASLGIKDVYINIFRASFSRKLKRHYANDKSTYYINHKKCISANGEHTNSIISYVYIWKRYSITFIVSYDLHHVFTIQTVFETRICYGHIYNRRNAKNYNKSKSEITKKLPITQRSESFRLWVMIWLFSIVNLPLIITTLRTI